MNTFLNYIIVLIIIIVLKSGKIVERKNEPASDDTLTDYFTNLL